MRRVIRTHCGCRIVCECPETTEWDWWCDADAVAFYCRLVAYRDREGHWFDSTGARVGGHQFDRIPSAGVTLFDCVRLAPAVATT
ncbi:hypothetical protein [Thiohalorhabdus methylotrophus]|uniref:Uncharacterized protein n=1 Tax=Thiohalorhabdus methylotrophus TaxID=3242694 RepID=A0ABV4TTD6_9GAMM